MAHAGQCANQAQGLNLDQDKVVGSLSQSSGNMQGIKTILAAMALDQGLAAYQGELQIFLKTVVNCIKSILAEISVMISNIPGLGPILGPSKNFIV